MAGAQRQASQTSSPQYLQCDSQRPPAATTRAAAPSTVSGDCAGHCGESRASSGDNARRSPFCSLWRLRRPLRRAGTQRRQRACCNLWRRQASQTSSPQHLQCDSQGRGPPAATTRAATRSAETALLQSLETTPATAESAAISGDDYAGHCGESRAPSGDNARRSPFYSLWTLRRPLRREPSPQRRQRAPQPLLQSLETAPATAERAGPPAATTRAAAPSAVSGHCAGHCRESRAPSGDNALWRLRRPLRREPGPQRRQRAPQPLLQSLDTAPATAERAGLPAATTRAAAPSTVSGDCAGHCGESRAPSGDNARRSPFCMQSLETTPATAGVRCDKKGE